MDRDLRKSRRRELNHRGILQQDLPGYAHDEHTRHDTIISADQGDLILTTASLKSIANIISNRYLKRKMSSREVAELTNFIRHLSPRIFQNMALHDAHKEIARQYYLKVTNPHSTSVGIDKPGFYDLHEYQKEELSAVTAEEHPYKYSTFYDEVGETAHIQRIRTQLGYAGYGLDSEGNVIDPTPVEGAVVRLVETLDHTQQLFNKYIAPRSVKDILRAAHSIRITHDDIALRDLFITLDSRHRDKTHNITGEYKFNIHHSTVRGHEGNIRVQSELKEILSIQVGEFWIPAFPDGNENQAFSEYYDKVRLFIKELEGQSSITQENHGNFHFEFTVTKSGSRLTLSPNPPYDKFVFRYPVARLESMTTIFLDPFETFAFLPDNNKYSFAFATNRFTANLGAGANQDLAVGDIVHITAFDNGVTSENNFANRNKGHVVTAVNNATGTFDIAGVFTADATNVCVFYGNKRIIIPFHFRTLE